MLSFIAFIIAILGGINWLLIGLLQYDFIAGLFGYQASIFSRIIYIIFGVAAIYLVIRAIANKGTFKIFERKKKKKMQEVSFAQATVEAGKEQLPVEEKENNQNPLPVPHIEQTSSKTEESLFDEHFKKNK